MPKENKEPAHPPFYSYYYVDKKLEWGKSGYETAITICNISM